MAVTYSPYSGPLDELIPFPVQVASQTVRSRTPLYIGEPDRYRSLTTDYSYYLQSYDRDRHELRGFGYVIAADHDYGLYRQTRFLTGPYDGGIVKSKFVANTASSSAPTYESSDYSLVSMGGGSYFPRLDKTHVLESYVKERTTTYTAYGAFGTPTAWTDDGWVSDSTDDIQHTLSLVTRDDMTARLVLPSEEKASANGQPLGTTRHYYDNANTFGATPTYGDQVRVDRERTAGEWVTTRTSYDYAGHVHTTSDEEYFTTLYSYDTVYHSYPVYTWTPLGVTYRSFHALTGQPAMTCGPQWTGSTWNCQRTDIDTLGRETAISASKLSGGVFALQLLKSISYDDNAYPLRTSVTTSRGDGTFGHAYQYRDGFGNATEVKIAEAGDTLRVFETAYDVYGYPLRAELARREVNSAYNHAPISEEAYLHDHDYVRGAIERMQEPRDLGNTGTPPTLTRVTGTTGSDIAVISVDEDNRTLRYALDAHGRVTRTTQLGGSAGDAVTTYSYDGNGNLHQVRDPNQLTTTYDRNYLGWVTRITVPDGTGTSFTHNRRGQVLGSLDARGVVLTYTLDSAGRVTGIVSSNEPANVRHVDEAMSYYASDDTTQLGRLKSESNVTTGIRYTYDAAGRVLSQTLAQGATDRGTIAFQYLFAGDLTRVTYPDGWAVDYHSNVDSSVKDVQVTSNGKVLASYLYEDDGQPSLLSNDLGLSEDYTYDIRGRLTGIASTNIALLGADLVDDRITWSKNNEVNQIERHGLNPDGTPRSTPDILVMSRDGLGRLTNVTRNGAAYAAYSYDLGGRLLQHDVSPSPQVVTYSTDKLMSRTFGTTAYTYNYDNAGNVVHSEQRINGSVFASNDHQWDARGRYSKSTIAGGGRLADWTGYDYLPSGAIVGVANPTELPIKQDLLYLGPWARLNLGAGIWTDSVLVNGKTVVELTGTTFEMPHRTYDETPLAVSDGTGHIVRQEEFKPYGHRVGGSAKGNFEAHYHGLRSDDVVVAGGRGYDPERGAWLSRDPLTTESPTAFIGTPELSNLYGFNSGDPMSHRDASGRSPGHHYVPQSVTRAFVADAGLSTPAAAVFMNSITGWPKGLDPHGFNFAHLLYNGAVTAELQAYIATNGIDPTKMTAEQATAFVESLRSSKSAVIRNFIEAQEGAVLAVAEEGLAAANAKWAQTQKSLQKGSFAPDAESLESIANGSKSAPGPATAKIYSRISQLGLGAFILGSLSEIFTEYKMRSQGYETAPVPGLESVYGVISRWVKPCSEVYDPTRCG
ncbi:MAG: hypothetical protein K8W52_44075 [Deltaproteobacteria bacterium]|nr:hypothetical protein [Deltaproteobacteria bacterium]